MENFPTSSYESEDRRIGAYDLIYDSFDSSLQAAGGDFARDDTRSAITDGLTQTVDAYVRFGTTYPLATYYRASTYTLTTNGMSEKTAKSWTTELLMELGATLEEIAEIDAESC